VRALLIALALLMAPTALAGPPEEADALHKSAVKAYKAGQLKKALEYWRQAQALAPSWKYSFNIATVQKALGRPKDAWESNQRTLRYGVPEKYRKTVLQQREQLEERLLEGHAWIELTVVPADAMVTRNGVPWPPPRRVWTREPASVLSVARDGYEPVEERWEHPTGARYNRTVELVRRQKKGRLLVSGAPAGARIFLDGRPVGQLPEYEAALPEGRYELEVRADGYVPWRELVSIKATAPYTAEVQLQVDTTPQASLTDSGLGKYMVGKWASLGLAAAALGLSGGLFAWASSESEDVEKLNNSVASGNIDYGTYNSRYDKQHSEWQEPYISAWVMVAIGTAAAATSITLFVLDMDEDGAEPIISPYWVPGGVGVSGHMKF
jgi:hypothetical protein